MYIYIYRGVLSKQRRFACAVISVQASAGPLELREYIYTHSPSNVMRAIAHPFDDDDDDNAASNDHEVMNTNKIIFKNIKDKLVRKFRRISLMC